MFRLKTCLCHLLVMAMVSLQLSPSAARAAMVASETVIEATTDELSDRARLRALVQRADIHAQLRALGVDPREAVARVDGLTDREVAEVAGKLDRLPAGADSTLVALTVVLLLALVAMTVLLIVYIVNVARSAADGVEWLFDEMKEREQRDSAGGAQGAARPARVAG